ncbi:hypothetical protein OEZ86_006175 [Tetradesmus obliquus]|nr:hypothetical protein OEZ86_006175 [Tetradesmus obliquus]
MDNDNKLDAASHNLGAPGEPVDPNQVLPPDQGPDLLEDTALPISGLQEAFAKAYQWQQQQQQPEQQGEDAADKLPGKLVLAATQSSIAAMASVL